MILPSFINFAVKVLGDIYKEIVFNRCNHSIQDHFSLKVKHIALQYGEKNAVFGNFVSISKTA